MTAFWRSKLGLATAIVLVVLMAAAVAWRIDARYSAAQERETKERIEKDAKQAIGKAMEGFKLCPLSDPDCNKR
jgi:uncharacterized membrane protein YqjE